MKYKIKVEVMQDGISRYYPMVKEHWWSVWKYIDCAGHTCFNGDGLYVQMKDVAEFRIKAYKGSVLDHTYEIPYKEKEQ